MAAWLLLILPLSTPVYDRVGILETNHFYDEQGRPVFDQLIFWDWDGCQDQVVAWKMIKGPDMLPRYSWKHEYYYILWHDSSQGPAVLRLVSAPSAIETWEQHDRELKARETLPVERRRGLGKP